jgi:hypothetical protein
VGGGGVKMVYNGDLHKKKYGILQEKKLINETELLTFKN